VRPPQNAVAAAANRRPSIQGLACTRRACCMGSAESLRHL
jgi:hypothetical protein